MLKTRHKRRVELASCRNGPTKDVDQQHHLIASTVTVNLRSLLTFFYSLFSAQLDDNLEQHGLR